MRRSQNLELIPYDPEIERTLRALRKALRSAESQSSTMAHDDANRPLKDFALPKATGIHIVITRPTVEANAFHLHPSLIQMVQNSAFAGSPMEDPHDHLSNFMDIAGTLKINGVTDEAIRLKLFPFSLSGKARSWLSSLPQNSITTWDDLASKFLTRFFPPAKTAQLRNAISNFGQQYHESLYEAWERYKELIRRCPHHGFPKWQVIHNFYNGLGASTRTLIDAAAGGAFMKKTQDAAYDLLEEMAMNSCQWPTERGGSSKVAGVYEIDKVDALAAKEIGRASCRERVYVLV